MQHHLSLKAAVSNNPGDTRSITDSAYQSMAESSQASTSSATHRSSGSETTLHAVSQPIGGSSLRRFKKGPTYRNEFQHFKGIRLAIEARLQKEVITFGREPWHHLAVQAEVVGRSEEEAAVHVLVVCAPYLEDLLNGVLAKEEIQCLLTIPHSTTTLGYLVVPVPPTSTSTHLGIDVCSQTSYFSTYDTHCGAPILLTTRGDQPSRKVLQQATFGGIIKVSFGQQAVCYYGMSAGHILSKPQDPNTGSPEGSTSSVSYDTGVTGWISSDNVLGQPLDPQQLPGITANHTNLAYDWSLFEVAEPHANRAIHPSSEELSIKANPIEAHSILMADIPHFQDDESDPVIMLGAVAGSRRGELLSIPARIWMAYSDSFVDAYVLEINQSKGSYNVQAIGDYTNINQ